MRVCAAARVQPRGRPQLAQILVLHDVGDVVVDKRAIAMDQVRILSFLEELDFLNSGGITTRKNTKLHLGKKAEWLLFLLMLLIISISTRSQSLRDTLLYGVMMDNQAIGVSLMSVLKTGECKLNTRMRILRFTVFLKQN